MFTTIKHPDSVNQVIFDNNFDENLQILEQSFKYFNTWPNGDIPKYQLPYQTDAILAPKNCILIQKVNQSVDLDRLQKIIDLSLKFPLITESIYLLSKDWLELDEHKIVKAEGEINYIFFKNKLYKVFEKSSTIANLIELNDLGSNIWFWKILL